MSEERPWRKAWRALLFIGLGALIGAGLDYLVRSDLSRQELLRQSRREAYVAFLKGEVDFAFAVTGEDREEYARTTAEARKHIALYGSSSTVQALSKFWRSHFEQPPCCGTLGRVGDDAAIYQRMRLDSLARPDPISDADMMLLMFLCKMPTSEEEVVPCPEIPSPEGQEPDA